MRSIREIVYACIHACMDTCMFFCLNVLVYRFWVLFTMHVCKCTMKGPWIYVCHLILGDLFSLSVRNLCSYTNISENICTSRSAFRHCYLAAPGGSTGRL